MRVLAGIRGLGFVAALVLVLFTAVQTYLPQALPADPDRATFIAFGGDAADLCGEEGHGDAHCPACKITQVAVLPGPSAMPVRIAYAAGGAWMPASTPSFSMPVASAGTVRGPPFV